MHGLKIGDVARRADVAVETIRYYEREGLLAAPERRPSGYRQYDESVVARLLFIRRAKALGFTLSEIKELLSLWFDVNTRCIHVRERAQRKIADIDERIHCLRNMKRSLQKLIRQCEQRDVVQECPLWNGLDRAVGHTINESSASKKASRS